MAATKAGAANDVWQAVAQNALLEGTVIDVSAHYGNMLHIDAALTSETAHLGTIIRVLISSAASADEFWTTLTAFLCLVGTANSEAITNNPLAAAATVITMASTTGYTAYGENDQTHFLKDATFANSELVHRIAHTTDTSIGLLDGVTREHANTAVLYNIARTFAIPIPLEALRVKVVYNNKYSASGSTIAVRSRIVNVTGV